ncbi:MAG: protein kinase [Thermoanaerobaculia bacterium]|nr:protein kinase [Thermoanaerobaculia bacterium]
MSSWNNLLWRIKTSGFWNYLPPDLREPPGVYLVIGGALLLVLLLLSACLLAIRAVLRRNQGSHAPGAAGSRNARRELKDAVKRGDYLAAAEIQQTLGNDRKALDLLARGGHHAERTELLLAQGRRDEARKVAREGGVWHVVAELAQEDGAPNEAALAWERAGKPFLAGRCWREAGDGLQAARCFIAAGLESEAVQALGDSEGREAAEILEQAVRSAISQGGGSSMSLEMTQAVRRAVQLWLAEVKPQRAWRLAVDSEQLELAAPIARDFLEPSVEAAELCQKAGALPAAADIWARLGDERREALARAEHLERRGNAAEAAEWLEKAGEEARAADQWAAAGELRKAAERYEKAGEFMSASELYAQVGDEVKAQEMQLRQGSMTASASFEDDPTVRASGPTGASSSSASPATGDSRLVTEGVLGLGVSGLSTVPAEGQAGGPSPPPQPDQRYRLLEELGRGGMGRVYRAEDSFLQRQVAYKVLPENLLQDPSSTPQALLAEARAAARLSHPNIVQIYDVGHRGGGVFVVMELVPGPTFEELLRQQQMSVPWLRRIGRQIADALAHAHARQIVHRDLKPSNLLWSAEEERVKLTDFGLARVSDDVSGKVATRPAGTPSYMSPEQIRGDDLDFRADIYAFGCVLFEMATGRPVFSTGISSLQQHLYENPADPRSLRSDLSDDVAQLVLDCLHKDPAQRPASAVELRQRLDDSDGAETEEKS